MLTGARARLSRIQRRSSTVVLASQAEVSLLISRLRRASGPFSPGGDVLPADTAVRRGER